MHGPMKVNLHYVLQFVTYRKYWELIYFTERG